MRFVPAVCERCGMIFQSTTFVADGVLSVRVRGWSVECPHCHGPARLLDGFYDSLNDTFRFLLTTNKSIHELEALRHALEAAAERKASLQEVKDTVETHAPELKTLLDWIPKTRMEGYAVAAIIISIIGLYIAWVATHPKGMTDTQVQELIDKAVKKTVDESKAKTTKFVISTKEPPPMNRAQRRAQKHKGRHK